MIKQTHASNRKKYVIVSLIAAVIVILALIFAYIHFHKNELPSATTTSTSPTAQKDYSSGNDRASNSNGKPAEGGAVDQKGVTSGVQIPAQNDWKKSDSGVITLQTPIENRVVKPGDTITGLSTLAEVQYRLVDDKYGVIAEGPLTVVDGKYSGKIQFTPSVTSGSLSIFSYDTKTGAESNRIKINILYEP